MEVGQVLAKTIFWFGVDFWELNPNSQAVGFDSWVQSALKSILRGTLFWIGCMIFGYYPLIHLYIYFWNQNSPKKFLDNKKNFIFEGSLDNI